MEISIQRKGSWIDVVDSARFTIGKGPLGHEPSDTFKIDILRAEHSPIRLLTFDVVCKDVPFYVITHITRHWLGIIPFVCSARPDRNGHKVERHEQRKDDITNFKFTINAQALINISRKRLCGKAEKGTREFWQNVIDEIRKIDPIMARFCIPECVYRGFCTEMKGCGFYRSVQYKLERDNITNYDGD